MVPGWDNGTATTASVGDNDVTTSGWFVVSSDYQNTYREEPEPLIMKREKQKFEKPLGLIGVSLPVQKTPYLNHRRNSTRL